MSDTHSLNEFKTAEEMANWYDKKYTEMGGGWSIPEEQATKILDFMELPVNPVDKPSLLDVGCGQGHFISFASQRATCLGIDLSPVIIDKANSMFADHAQFLIADIEDFPYVKDMFDYVTTVGSMEHCLHIDLAFKKVYEILKQNGKFFVLVPNEEWQHFDQPQEQTHTDEEWIDIFTKAGFKISKQLRQQDLSWFLLVK